MIYTRFRSSVAVAALVFAIAGCGSEEPSPPIGAGDAVTPPAAAVSVAPTGTDDRKTTCDTVSKAMTDSLTSLLTADGDKKEATVTALTELRETFAKSEAKAADAEVRSTLHDAGAALDKQIESADPTVDNPAWEAAAADLEKLCPRGA